MGTSSLLDKLTHIAYDVVNSIIAFHLTFIREVHTFMTAHAVATYSPFSVFAVTHTFREPSAFPVNPLPDPITPNQDRKAQSFWLVNKTFKMAAPAGRHRIEGGL